MLLHYCTHFVIYIYHFFSREEILKAILPIRNIFPSLLKSLQHESRESSPEVSVPDQQQQQQQQPETSPLPVTEPVAFTVCPVCKIRFATAGAESEVEDIELSDD